METKNDVLEPDVMDAIQPFSGTPDEMTVEQKMLMEGMPLQKVQTSYTTAVSVQKPRSITRITNNVLAEARLAGSAFYYGWTAKGKSGPAKIEGPSIDLAMCLVRNYGNSAIELEASETLTHYMLKACFVDLESGVTLPRIFRQRKSQRMGGKMDEDRQEDIVFQIGQSKAIRNAIIRAMPNWLIDQAIETAKEAELSKIRPENIALAREKALSFFSPYGITQERMEAKIGRKADDWTPQDIVDLRANAVAVKEGRVKADDLFPDESVDQSPVSVSGGPIPGQEIPEGKTTNTDEQFIEEFTPLRSQFPTWFWKNIERIKVASPTIKRELEIKWKNSKACEGEVFPLLDGSIVDEATGEIMGATEEERTQIERNRAQVEALKDEPSQFQPNYLTMMDQYEETLDIKRYNRILMARGYKDKRGVPIEMQTDVLAAMSAELDAQNS